MTWDNLTADLTTMKAGNMDMFTVDDVPMPDEDILEIYKDAAKQIMRMDIEVAIQCSPSDDVTIDAVTDKHSARLSVALAYKQLHLYYLENEEGEGSRSRMRLEHYKKLYEEQRTMSFHKLKLEHVARITFPRINR